MRTLILGLPHLPSSHLLRPLMGVYKDLRVKGDFWGRRASTVETGRMRFRLLGVGLRV